MGQNIIINFDLFPISRLKQEEVRRIQEEVQAKDEETRRLQEEVEEARRRQEEVAAAMVIATTTPAHHHVTETSDDDDDAVTNGHELVGGDENYVDRLNDRQTHAERNERIQQQLRVKL